LGGRLDKKTVNRLALKLNRIAEGKNQRSLAKEIHRSQAWLSRVERGDRASVVTDADLRELAAALGVKSSDLEAG